MRNPFYIFTRSELIFMLAIFLLGIITGATFLNLIISQKLDLLILEKNQLETELEEISKENENLARNLREQRYNFVQKLDIHLETDLNQHKQQAAIELIKQLLSNIPGQRIDRVNPLMLRDIIHNRYILIEGTTYQLQLIYVVMHQEMQLYIKINPL